MPATVQVKVIAARNLPIMDRSSELTDAFVELRLVQNFEKTEVCAKTLNPTWDSKWFTFKVDEEDLQEEPLQVRVMDHDTYSAHNAIGKVYIPLNSLADDSNKSHGQLDGWFPIYDTLHGIRGEVHLAVKVEVLKDQHRFRQSSCGIMFFMCPETPSCYTTRAIHGFVEELVVNDDPEYKWIDRIRTPRASNEARQRLFARLTGELQRKIGLRTIDVGGNAVIGYHQYFDLEGDTGIVVRGIGTCVSLIPILQSPSVQLPVLLPSNIQGGSHTHIMKAMPQDEYAEPGQGVMSPKQRMLFRKTSSSDSDGPSSPNRGSGSFSGMPPPPLFSGSMLATSGHHVEGTLAPNLHSGANLVNLMQHIIPSSDFPFYTLTSLPPGLLRHVGGIVSSRSVKLLDKIKDPDEPETRDVWWQEVRNEVRSHAQAMGCNAVVGYSESTSICDTLCILSAFGTAVCIRSPTQVSKKQTSPGSSVEDNKDTEMKESTAHPFPHCGVCHVPYISNPKAPFEGELGNCSLCGSSLVPAVILSTAEPPSGIAIRGNGTLIQVRVVLSKRRLKGDENATFVSKQLPFLEFKLYTRLLNKVRIRGMNAVFCLHVQYSVGDTIIIALATGTGVYLEALPPPSKLSIVDKDKSSNAERLLTIQDALNESQQDNMEKYGLKQHLDLARTDTGGSNMEEEVSGLSELSLSMGRQEAFVFEVEDHRLKEEDIMELILDKPLPKGFYVSNSHHIPGLLSSSLSAENKLITMVVKKSLESSKQHLDKQCAQLFDELHQALGFKIRRSSPCWVTRICYDMDVPEDDTLQVAITAMVSKLQTGESSVKKSHSDEMIFAMEGLTGQSPGAQGGVASDRQQTENKACAVCVTPLPFVHDCRVEKYLRIVNFFVIRESTSIRESGGLDSFMHLFTLEALAIARAHVAAIGGNTLLNFRLNDCVLIEHPHKNQAQCLLNVSGDAAIVIPCPSTQATNTSNSSQLGTPTHQSAPAEENLSAVKTSAGEVTAADKQTAPKFGQAKSTTSLEKGKQKRTGLSFSRSAEKKTSFLSSRT